MKQTPEQRAKALLAQMTLDEKISQMIMPCVRYWNEENMTDLSAYPELEEALRAHQYGGIILFGANITGNEQRCGIKIKVIPQKSRKTQRHRNPEH